MISISCACIISPYVSIPDTMKTHESGPESPTKLSTATDQILASTITTTSANFEVNAISIYPELEKIPDDNSLGYLVAYSPLGESFVAMPNYFDIVSTDAESGLPNWEISVPHGEWGMNGKTHLNYSPSGKYISTGGRDLRLDVINAEEGSLLNSYYTDVIFGVDELYRYVAFISDSLFVENDRYILLSSYTDNGGLARIDTLEETAEVVFEKPTFEIVQVPDQSVIAMATGPVGNSTIETDAPIVLFDYINLEIVRTLFEREISDEGESLYSPLALSVSVSPNGRFIASVVDGELRIWDLSEEKEIEVFITEKQFPFDQVLFSPNGDRLVTVSGGACARIFNPYDSERANCSLIVWEVPSWEILGSSTIEPIVSLEFSPDSKLLASGSFEGVSFWKVP